MLQALDSLTFSKGADFWIWCNDSSTIYSMRSSYKCLHMRANVVDERSKDIVQLIARVWESLSPLKVNFFSWQLL